MEVKIKHFKTDFMVGNTANYVGYFPLILHHRYEKIWLNIERSADDTMTTWNGESINHQWCKSKEYFKLSVDLFNMVSDCDWFDGFHSTLHGLYDISIYKIVSQHPSLLKETHSCNYGKPWCCECVKCCFCYLMMSAYLGEEYAMSVVGSSTSLFEKAENTDHWKALFDENKVAWECVPSSAECLEASQMCLDKGISYDVLRQKSDIDSGSCKKSIYWDDVPEQLHEAVKYYLE